ncbi:MAG: ATP-dependent helicase, partial [Actinomycetota bacterium]
TSSGGEVHVRNFNSMLEETEYIADRIRSLEKKEEIKPENIAVIIKGLGYETHLIENALKQSGIAFIRRSSRSMLDNYYVLYIINYLTLNISLHDINKKDQGRASMASGGNGQNYTNGGRHQLDGLLENHLLSEITGLDPLFYIKLRSDYLRSCGLTTPGTGCKNPSFWEHICKNAERGLPDIPDGESAGWEKLKGIISSLNKSLKAIDWNIYEFLMDFLEDPVSGLFRLLKEKDAVSYPGYFYSSWVGIGDFLESVKEYCIVEPESDTRTYTGYLENLIENNFLEEIEESTREQAQKGMVNILSFHQCKGLEYDAVFIPFINNNYLPSKFRQPQIFDLQIFRTIDKGRELSSDEIQKEHMESEVRLFYNGLTRARKKLYITSSRSKGISIFFKKVQAAARDIAHGEKDQDSEGGTVKSRLKEMEVFDGIDKKWLAKKKMMVALERAGGGLRVDYEYLIKRAVELKYLYPVVDWWNLIQPTINYNIPYQVYPPLFNYSGLNTYRDCPFKYKVKYFYKIPEEENLNLIVGKIYHNVLKDFFDMQPKDRSWEEFTDIIGKNFETEQFDFLFIKEELLLTAMKDFKRYFENFMPPAQTRNIMEKEFNFSLEDSKIRGRIDQIN